MVNKIEVSDHVELYYNNLHVYSFIREDNRWIDFTVPSAIFFGRELQNTPEDLHLVELLYARD